MKLHELQRALQRAGIDAVTVEQCAEAMTMHKHCSGTSAQLTSMQAARMLWLVLICQDTAVVRTESLLMESTWMPRQRGRDGSTVLQFLAAAIRNASLAAAIERIEVDAGKRLVTVDMRDDEPLLFAAPEGAPYVSAPIGSIEVCGAFLCRLAMAYSSAVWLPINTDSILRHDPIQQEQGTRNGAAIQQLQ